jgi:hypothetical protein
MATKRMYSPSSRAELERNIFLLGEKMRAGKIHFARHMSHTMDGLRRLRKLPNGRVDLLSLDEMTRLNANMMANMPTLLPPATADSEGSSKNSDSQSTD